MLDDTTAPQDKNTILPSQMVRVSLKDITPDPEQPRQIADDEELTALAKSIGQLGLLQAITVVPIDGVAMDDPGPHFQIVVGERRWRASALAGMEYIDCRIAELSDFEDGRLIVQAAENLGRQALSPAETIEMVRRLSNDDTSVVDAAGKIGLSPRTYRRYLKILQDPIATQQLRDGVSLRQVLTGMTPDDPDIQGAEPEALYGVAMPEPGHDTVLGDDQLVVMPSEPVPSAPTTPKLPGEQAMTYAQGLAKTWPILAEPDRDKIRSYLTDFAGMQ